MTTKLKYQLSAEEFQAKLNTQLQYINRSCLLYDQGFEDEAYRIAVAIRVLLHDTKTSTSVLEHLKIKSKIDYWDSAAAYDPTNLLVTTALCSLQLSGGQTVKAKYIPCFDGPNSTRGSWQGYQWWWNKQPVIVDRKKNSFTRSKLILVGANKEGGAHVDAALDQEYAELVKGFGIGWIKFKGDESIPWDNDIVKPSIRQIAFEVQKTLGCFGPTTQ